MDEFARALDTNSAPDPAEYAARVPGHADSLRLVFKAMLALETHLYRGNRKAGTRV